MPARVYFYRDGKELTDHPANGLEYTGMSATVGHIGRYRCHAQIFVKKPGRNNPSCLVDVTDFDGKPCMAKLWFPRKEYNEKICFCSREQVAEAGGTVTDHDISHIGRDGRGVEFQGHWPFDVWLAEQAEKQAARSA